MKLFKYLHPDRTDVLEKAKIRYSSPKVLNDPFEIKPHLTGITPSNLLISNIDLQISKMIVDEYEKLPKEIRRKISIQQLESTMRNNMGDLKNQIALSHVHILPAIQNKMEEKFNELMGILCLTESPKNLLMWAHYADSHQGFVIEFDSTNPYFDRRYSSEDDFRILKKVIYSDTRPNIDVAEITNIDPFLTKSDEWRYEEEWRIMDSLENASEIYGNDENAIHLYNFPRSLIKTVIFGCKLSQTKKSEIKQILKKYKEYSSVVCLQASMHKSKFEILFEREA